MAINQQDNDYNMGLMAEQRGIRGQIRRGFRNHFMGDDSWVMKGAEAMNTGTAYYADMAGDKFQQVSDYMIGVEGRGYYQGGKRIAEDIASGNGVAGAGDIGAVGSELSASAGFNDYSPEQINMVKEEYQSRMKSLKTSEGRKNYLINRASQIKRGNLIGRGVATGSIDTAGEVASSDEAYQILQQSGINDDKLLAQARSDLGVSDGDKISGYMSQGERSKDFKKMFGDGFAVQDIDAALGDENFEGFMSGIDSLYKSFDPRSQKQSSDYKAKQGNVVHAYESLSPKAKAVADRWLQRKGIKIQGGEVIFERDTGGGSGFIAGLAGFDTTVDTRGGLLGGSESDRRSIFGNARGSLDSEQSQMAVSGGIEAISGRKISFAKGQSIGSQMGLVTDALGGVAQAKLDKIIMDKSAPLSMRKAAALEHKRRNGGLSSEESSRMVSLLAESGLSGTEGESIAGFDKLDKTGVGGNSADKIQRDSLFHMVELAKIVEGMNKK
jgi:hypothetical protein